MAAAPNFKGVALKAMGGKKRGAVPAGGRAPGINSRVGKQRMGAGQKGDAGTNFEIHGEEAANIADELAAQLDAINAQGSSFSGPDVAGQEGDAYVDDATVQDPTTGPNPDLQNAPLEPDAENPDEDPETRRQRLLALMGLS
jgi:hypothetical protein